MGGVSGGLGKESCRADHRSRKKSPVSNTFPLTGPRPVCHHSIASIQPRRPPLPSGHVHRRTLTHSAQTERARSTRMQTLDEPTVGGNEMVTLLQALTALKKGRRDARLPSDSSGVAR